MEGRANKLALETDLRLGLLCGWALRMEADVGWRTARRKGLRKGAAQCRMKEEIHSETNPVGSSQDFSPYTVDGLL